MPDWRVDKRQHPSVSHDENSCAKRLPESRRVELQVNVINLHEVNDHAHTFKANVLIMVFWNAQPMHPNTKSFMPWIQLHNAESVEVLPNPGMKQWNQKELDDHVTAWNMNDNKKGTPCYVIDMRNYVASFICSLDFYAFPFDEQKLRITIISNMSSDVTLTQKIPDRDKLRNRTYGPGVNVDASTNRDSIETARTIKCNLENDTMSEWNAVLENDGLKIGMGQEESVKAVCIYQFREHDKSLSAEGKIYQRLDLYVVVYRQVQNFVVAVVIPTALLCAASLSVFSLDVVDRPGDRLSVLTTIVLAIVANSYVSSERLPHVDYNTWADKVLLSLSLFVYFVILETSICAHLESREADTVLAYVFLVAFLIIMAVMFWSALGLHKKRQFNDSVEREKHKQCFWREEDRLLEVETGIVRRTNPANPFYDFMVEDLFELKAQPHKVVAGNVSKDDSRKNIFLVGDFVRTKKGEAVVVKRTNETKPGFERVIVVGKQTIEEVWGLDLQKKTRQRHENIGIGALIQLETLDFSIEPAMIIKRRKTCAVDPDTGLCLYTVLYVGENSDRYYETETRVLENRVRGVINPYVETLENKKPVVVFWGQDRDPTCWGMNKEKRNAIIIKLEAEREESTGLPLYTVFYETDKTKESNVSYARITSRAVTLTSLTSRATSMVVEVGCLVKAVRDSSNAKELACVTKFIPALEMTEDEFARVIFVDKPMLPQYVDLGKIVSIVSPPMFYNVGDRVMLRQSGLGLEKIKQSLKASDSSLADVLERIVKGDEKTGLDLYRVRYVADFSEEVVPVYRIMRCVDQDSVMVQVRLEDAAMPPSSKSTNGSYAVAPYAGGE